MLGLPCVIFPPDISSPSTEKCPSANFFLICRNVRIFYYLLFLKGFAYCKCSEAQKYICAIFFKECVLVMLYEHCPSQKQIIYAVGLWNVSENFGTEILNNLKPVRNMRKKSFTLNIVHMKLVNY